MKDVGRLLSREEMLPIVKEDAFAEIKHASRLRDLDKEYFAMVLIASFTPPFNLSS